MSNAKVMDVGRVAPRLEVALGNAAMLRGAEGRTPGAHPREGASAHWTAALRMIGPEIPRDTRSLAESCWRPGR